MRASGKLIISQQAAAELSPGEFAHRVRTAAQDTTVKTVVINSLNGCQAAMPQENSLILHMHELLQFLNRADGVEQALQIGRRSHGRLRWRTRSRRQARTAQASRARLRRQPASPQGQC